MEIILVKTQFTLYMSDLKYNSECCHSSTDCISGGQKDKNWEWIQDFAEGLLLEAQPPLRACVNQWRQCGTDAETWDALCKEGYNRLYFLRRLASLNIWNKLLLTHTRLGSGVPGTTLCFVVVQDAETKYRLNNFHKSCILSLRLLEDASWNNTLNPVHCAQSSVYLILSI